MKITTHIEEPHVCMDSEQRTHKAEDPDKEKIEIYARGAEKTEIEFDPEIDQGALPGRLEAQGEQDRLHLRLPSRYEKKDMEIEEQDRELLRKMGKA